MGRSVGLRLPLPQGNEEIDALLVKGQDPAASTRLWFADPAFGYARTADGELAGTRVEISP
ncbi:MAG: hypothetical protein WAR57_08820, partial [Candidatus Phosphoribacter sp.]